jgi:predicted transcriptional regulator
MDGSELDLTSWTADIVSAYVAHNVDTSKNLARRLGCTMIQYAG